MHRRVRHFNAAQAGAKIVLDARFISGVADGAALATWSSRPVATINATQGTGSSQPTYRASQINGRPAVQFDGTGDFMSLDAAALSLTNNIAGAFVCAVSQHLASGDADQLCCIFSTGSSAAAARISMSSRSAAGNLTRSQSRRLDADSLVNSGFLTTQSVPVVLSGMFDFAGGTFTHQVNGANSTAGSYALAGNTSATNSLAANIGAVSAASTRLNGYLSAFVFFNTLPDIAIRRRVRQHLGFSFRIATS